MITKLTPDRHDLIWGSGDTEPWYPNPERLRTAEVWYPSGELLIKFLFTTDNLSVQVHPNDAQAQLTGKPRGKTEMWHILRAEPGAKIALGLNRGLSGQGLRSAAIDGSIVEMLNWISVSPGQTFFVPAGTIHAIGAGIALCEIQQLSDITYRLYDWGRGRELHLDAGITVSKCEAGGEGPVDLPVQCQYFRTEVVTVRGAIEVLGNSRTLIALEGAGTISGLPFGAGDVFRSVGEAVAIQAERARFLVTGE